MLLQQQKIAIYKLFSLDSDIKLEIVKGIHSKTLLCIDATKFNFKLHNTTYNSSGKQPTFVAYFILLTESIFSLPNMGK